MEQPKRSRQEIKSPTNPRRKRSISPNDDEKPLLATHALTFLVCGLKVRWKQVVAYELTSNSFNGKVVADYTRNL